MGLLSTTSCRKNANPHWDTQIVAPIITSRLDVGDIFGDENVVGNPDQSMSLNVFQKIEMLQTDLVLQMDDTLSTDIFNLPFTITISPGQKVIEKQNLTTLDFGEMELSLARASTAKMKFYVTNTITQPLLVKYTLTSASKNGVIFEVTETVDAATDTTNTYVVKTIDLDEYEIDMTGPSHNSFNTIYSTTTVWIHPDADTVIVTPFDSVIIISTFDEFIPEYAHGYIGKHQLDEQGSSPIKVFGDFKEGSFDLQNVKATIDINNYIGADLSFELQNLSTKKNSPLQQVSLNHSVIGTTINMLRASESNIPTYPVWPQNKNIDISNSNLDQMIEIMPDSFRFHIAATINPLGNISSGNDFIYFNHGVDAKISLDIPLNFSANNLIIEDYSSFSFDNESVKSGQLNIYLENLFPFDLDVQFYLLNNEEQIIDSLFGGNTIVKAAETMNGIASVPFASELNVELNSQLLNSLHQSSKMLIRARINSSANQPYILYEHYGMDIKIVGDFNYEY